MAAKLSEVSKSFPYPQGWRRLSVLEGFSLAANPGEVVALLGPSGCGKTTILRILGGIEEPDVGSVEVCSLEGKGKPKVGFAFQDHRLFPWRSAAENVALPLRLRGEPRNYAECRALAVLNDLGLSGFHSYYPPQLSVGMQQRVSLARALAVDPDLLLLDEPLTSLDELTRDVAAAELLRAIERCRATVILVTHDPEEAVLLADRVILLSAAPARVLYETAVPLTRPRIAHGRHDRKIIEIAAAIREQICENVGRNA